MANCYQSSNKGWIKIEQAVKKLNDKPRKKWGFKTPYEVFYGCIQKKSKLTPVS